MSLRRTLPPLVFAVTGCAALIGSSACSSNPDTTEVPPPRVCKTPGAASTKWFTDATGDVGLGGAVATSVVSADFDGDGWADLLAFRGESTRGLVDGKRVRFLFMNRPDPNDATKRVFVDVPDQAGLLETRDGAGNRGASIALLGDLDGDGDVDVITCPSDFTTNEAMLDTCAAFLNDGKAHFTLAPESALDGRYPATSAVLLDWNRDGILDFWPAGMAHWPYGGIGGKWKTGPRLFGGAGDGTFTEVTSQVGLPTVDGKDKDGTSFRHTFGVTTCDIDDDGDMDILTASYGRQENQVWRNDGDHFTNAAALLGLDHDDRMDPSDDQSYRCWCASNACDPQPPKPQVNCGSFGNPYFRGWYPGVTDQPWNLGGNNFGVACVDVDDDGDQDVMFATVIHGDTGSASDPTELAVNPGGGKKFIRPGNDKTGLARPPLALDGNYGDNEPVFADVDLDGRKDLFLTSTVYPESRPWLWRQKADGTFEEIGIPAGLGVVDPSNLEFSVVSQGVDFVDIDGDGDLDLITGSVSTGNAVHVYRNEVGQSSNFTRLRLVGKGAGHSNVSAIGARVRVTAGGRTQTLEVKGGAGIGAIQNDFVLTFGLGASCDIEKIEVRWPDAAGTTTTYTGVLANYTVTLKEGDATPHYQK